MPIPGTLPTAPAAGRRLHLHRRNRAAERGPLPPIGWQSRVGIEDGRNLVHYYRLTPDNRLLMGGGRRADLSGRRVGEDRHAATRAELEAHVRRTFPSLAGVRFTHHWGGPVSVPLDMAPAMGYVGDDRRLMVALAASATGWRRHFQRRDPARSGAGSQDGVDGSVLRQPAHDPLAGRAVVHPDGAGDPQRHAVG